MQNYDNDFSFLDNIQYMALIEEPDATIKFANEHFCNFFGLPPEKVVGRRLFDFLVYEDRAACDAQYMVSPENPHYRVEGRAIAKDGAVHWLQFVGSGLFNAKGELTEFQEVCVDISMWKEQIESEVRNLSKTHMYISSVSDNSDTGVSSGSDSMTTLDKNKEFGNIAIYTFDDIITRSPKMETLIKQARRIAHTNSTVMIEGESGTGKELFAQAIHNASKRAASPFVAINCGSIAPELLQSELFGYVSGAFTGAAKEGKAGKFELADNGTLFFDEIGEMPLNQQISLLRVLETHTITRMGDHNVIPVNTRIICATNKNLFAEVCAGRFRSDLYFRLNVINLRIPPLRERKEDIYPLLQSILREYIQNEPEREIKLSQDQMKILYSSNWPGNVRELRNIAERLIYMPDYDLNQILTYESHMNFNKETGEWDVSDTQHGYIPSQENTAPSADIRESIPEETNVRDTIERCRGNITLAAKDLGISRNTLYKKIRKYGIEVKRD